MCSCHHRCWEGGGGKRKKEEQRNRRGTLVREGKGLLGKERETRAGKGRKERQHMWFFHTWYLDVTLFTYMSHKIRGEGGSQWKREAGEGVAGMSVIVLYICDNIIMKLLLSILPKKLIK